MVLSPGDLVEVEARSGNVAKTGNPEAYLGFKDENSFLTIPRLAEIALLLQDTYGVKVNISDAVPRKRVYGYLPDGQP